MNTTEILRWAYAHMEYPFAIFLSIPLIIFIFWALRKEFIQVKDDLEAKIQKRKVRNLLRFTRPLMILLVCAALTSPYLQREKIIDGDPYVELLIDNSTSMAVFEDMSAALSARLEKKTNTEVKSIGTPTVSNIGDSVLSSIKPHSSIVLLSDGNANSGASLGDVALYAAKLNASVNAIRLRTVKDDAAVTIFGPSKALENSENTFTVAVNKVGNLKTAHLKVTLDGETLFDQQTSDAAYQFTRKLTKGNHKITAQVSAANDFFPQNNVFYKTTRVVPQPKILLYSEKTTPLEQFLKQIYVVDTASSIPSNLDSYYSIVINDIGADRLNPVSDVLNDYVADGNGLVVFGGENSYEKGNYRNSIFEAMLPVLVGAPEKKEGDIVIGILIDVSGSQGTPFGRFKSTADFSKSATLDIIKNLKIDTRVGIFAFNTQAYLLSEPSPVFAKQGLDDLIGRLKWGGGTNIAAGLLKTMQVLNSYTGSKNIVLLSDGKTQGAAAAYEAAKFAANSGIKIYTVGVGPSTDEKVMMDIAEITNGIYFRATEESRLKILFGPVDENEAKSGQMDLVILNKNHFITDNFEPNATLYGFNQVSPKGAARLLATTSTGDPVLTIWRLGLGRVGAYSVDDGSKWAGALLGKGNSKLIARTMNWAIGDPERKSESFIDAKDTRLNEPVEITVKSKQMPETSGMVFYKIDEDTYSGNMIPSATGFQEVAGAVFAVNYETEYEQLGMSKELESIVASTGGKIFDANDVDGIVDHAKSKAQRVVNDKDYLRWPFIIAAMILFIVEIFIRRIVRKE